MSRRRIARDLAPLALVLLLVLTAWLAPRHTSSRVGVLAVLVDVSESIGRERRRAAVEKIDEQLQRLPGSAPVAVFAVAEDARLLGFGTAGEARGWLTSTAEIHGRGDRTAMADAVRDATRLVQAAGGGSLLVASDGADRAMLHEAVRDAIAAGVELHVMPIDTHVPDVALVELRLPQTPTPNGQPVDVVALVRSTVDQPVAVTLEHDGLELAAVNGVVTADRLHSFRFLVDAGSVPGLLLARVSADRNADRANDIGQARFNGTRSPRLAVVGESFGQGLDADLLPRVPPPTVARRYDAMLIRLDGATDLSAQEQRTLVEYVESGHGLVLGFDDPRAAVALRGGPLDAVLPVRLEPPDRAADRASVVLLVDRSGSMDGATADDSALQTAGRAATAMAVLLGQHDRYGLIAFDVEAHTLRPLGPVGGEEDRGSLPALDATGGTDWRPALERALGWLVAERADVRHVVLITDGRLAPGVSEEPAGEWPVGVTLSTVSVGEDAAVDELERLAERHGGRHEHLSRLDDLPTALRREAAELRLPERREGPQIVRPEPAFAHLLPAATVQGPLLVVTPDEFTEVALRNEHGDPLLTFGSAGWGVTAFLAADPASLSGDGQAILAGALLRSVGARDGGTEMPRLSLRQGRAVVELLLDGSGPAGPQGVVRLPSGATRKLEFIWAAPGRARAEIAAAAPGEYVVDVNGARTRFTVGHSTERAVKTPEPDWAAGLAALGGGRVIDPRPSGVSGLRPRDRRVRRDVAPWLIGLAALVFFIDSGLRFRRSRTQGWVRESA